MYEKAKIFTMSRPRLKKTVGWVLVVVGFLALVTPLTPGGFLLLIGLELVGLRFVFLDKLLKRKARSISTVASSPVAVLK